MRLRLSRIYIPAISRPMPTRHLLPVAGLAVLLLCRGVLAEDQPFLTLDATDIEPQFGREFEQDFNWAIDRPASTGLEMHSEIEYGLRDNLQIAGAADYGWERATPAADTKLRFAAVSGELIYRPLNVYFDPLGVAVLVSPSVGPDLFEVEAKLLAQKNFINDRLRVVVNAGWTGARQREPDAGVDRWENKSTLSLGAGLSYNITWAISAGIEFDNERDFEGFDGGGSPESSVSYAGPTFQFVDRPLTMSLGIQAQLPYASGPVGISGTLHNGFAADAERYRVTFRVTRAF
jgi:hypothetical protein